MHDSRSEVFGVLGDENYILRQISTADSCTAVYTHTYTLCFDCNANVGQSDMYSEGKVGATEIQIVQKISAIEQFLLGIC